MGVTQFIGQDLRQPVVAMVDGQPLLSVVNGLS